MPVCQYCNVSLSNISSLNNHQKRTKKCLLIQGISPIGEFKCLTCTCTFLTKISLSSHTIACNKKHLAEVNTNIIKRNQIQELEHIENIKQNNLLQAEKIAFLETRLFTIETKYNILLEEKKTTDAKYDTLIEKITTEALSKTHKTINNTVNISVFNRTDDEIKNIYSNNLTIEHIAAKLIVDKVIRDVTGMPMITITDKSRGNAKYKLSTGEIVLDNGLEKFTEKHRDMIIKRMYLLATKPEYSSDFLDTESKTCSGYNEIIDDTNGANLKKNIIKQI